MYTKPFGSACDGGQGGVGSWPDVWEGKREGIYHTERARNEVDYVSMEHGLKLDYVLMIVEGKWDKSGVAALVGGDGSDGGGGEMTKYEK